MNVQAPHHHIAIFFNSTHEYILLNVRQKKHASDDSCAVRVMTVRETNKILRFVQPQENLPDRCVPIWKHMR